MKAAIYKGIEQIEIEEVVKPEINDDTALVRVLAVGICGTDLKTYKRGHPMFRPPCVLGHEFVGMVERVGKNMDETFENGKYVIAPYLECGKCEICKRGIPQLCAQKFYIEGALAEYIRVPSEILKYGAVRIPEGIDESTATLAEPLACAVHGVEMARISKNDRVLIVGAGSMGLLIAIYLKNKNCDVTVSEVDDNRIAVAKFIGIKVVDAKIKSVTELAKENGKFNSIILANDKGTLVPGLLSNVEIGGTLELFGGMPKDTRIEVDPYFIHYKEINIVGTFGFAKTHFIKAANMIFSDSESFSKLISKKFPMRDIKNAFCSAMDTKNIKVVVEI